jgi:hypothetical protein
MPQVRSSVLRPVLAAEECRSAAAATAGENATEEVDCADGSCSTVGDPEKWENFIFFPLVYFATLSFALFIGALFFCSIVFILPSFTFDCREKDMLVFVR